MRPYTPSDLEQVNSWLIQRELPTFQDHFLPKTGFIIENTAVGFLYKTDSSFCWLEWVVTNPKANSTDRNKALDLIVSKLLEEAKSSGFKIVFTSLQDTGLIERYSKHGFMITEKNMTNLIRGIN